MAQNKDKNGIIPIKLTGVNEKLFKTKYPNDLSSSLIPPIINIGGDI